jgi:hypothetical protein
MRRPLQTQGARRGMVREAYAAGPEHEGHGSGQARPISRRTQIGGRSGRGRIHATQLLTSPCTQP